MSGTAQVVDLERISVFKGCGRARMFVLSVFVRYGMPSELLGANPEFLQLSARLSSEADSRSWPEGRGAAQARFALGVGEGSVRSRTLEAPSTLATWMTAAALSRSPNCGARRACRARGPLRWATAIRRRVRKCERRLSVVRVHSTATSCASTGEARWPTRVPTDGTKRQPHLYG